MKVWIDQDLCTGDGLCEDFLEDATSCPADCGTCCGNGDCEEKVQEETKASIDSVMIDVVSRLAPPGSRMFTRKKGFSALGKSWRPTTHRGSSGSSCHRTTRSRRGPWPPSSAASPPSWPSSWEWGRSSGP